jgi:hypothetical protein
MPSPQVKKPILTLHCISPRAADSQRRDSRARTPPEAPNGELEKPAKSAGAIVDVKALPLMRDRPWPEAPYIILFLEVVLRSARLFSNQSLHLILQQLVNLPLMFARPTVIQTVS